MQIITRFLDARFAAPDRLATFSVPGLLDLSPGQVVRSPDGRRCGVLKRGDSGTATATAGVARTYLLLPLLDEADALDFADAEQANMPDGRDAGHMAHAANLAAATTAAREHRHNPAYRDAK